MTPRGYSVEESLVAWADSMPVWLVLYCRTYPLCGVGARLTKGVRRLQTGQQGTRPTTTALLYY